MGPSGSSGTAIEIGGSVYYFPSSGIIRRLDFDENEARVNTAQIGSFSSSGSWNTPFAFNAPADFCL